jgi:hypothetical protein
MVKPERQFLFFGNRDNGGDLVETSFLMQGPAGLTAILYP